MEVTTSGTSTTITWTPVIGANGYTLQRKGAEGGNQGWANVPDYNGTDTWYTEENLDVGKVYEYRLQAVGSNDEKEFSITLLEAPTLTEVVAAGSSTIRVEWTVVDNASGYRVQYFLDENFDADNTITLQTSGTLLVLSELNAATTYYVHVMAIGSGLYKSSGYSGVESATTEEEVNPQLPAPDVIT